MQGRRGASREAGGPGGWWRYTRGIHGDGPTQGLGAKGTRGERTLNMLSMVVTLEVSKLSGWLKAVADCRVEGKACDAGGKRCELGGERAWGLVVANKRHAQGWPDSRVGVGAKGTRGERTWNMRLMSVTLEVSKLSGWLKADAACRVDWRACDAGEERCELGSGRARGVVAARQEARTGKKPDSRLGGQGHARSARGTFRSWS